MWNATGRFQGSSDVELSERGRSQADAIARRLAGERIDRIYASDLVRALETARILAEPHALEVAPDARLREFSFGEWEGLTWPQIVARRPHLREAGPTVAVDYAPEGGETFAQVAARLRSFFDDLQPQDNERILIVTHAGPLHAVLSVLDLVNDGPTAGVSFSPAGLTRIAMEGGRARLISLNDVRHLHSRG